MPGILKRFARERDRVDQETLEVRLPVELIEGFRTYVASLNLTVDEALRYLIAEELQGGGQPDSRPERYRNFWSGVLERMNSRRTPLAQSWYSFSSGHRGVSYTLAFAKDGRIRIDLYIDRGDQGSNRRALEMLKTMRTDIDHHFPRALSWEQTASRRSCRVALYRSGRITDDNLDELAAWLVRGLELFQEVFEPLLPKVDGLS